MNSSLYEKAVLRYKDGRMLKCEIFKNLSVTQKTIKIMKKEGGIEDVKLEDLKAVFFVKEFDGLATHKDTKEFSPNTPRAGKRLEVELFDGEVVRGTVRVYNENTRGFFIDSADTEANNTRIFVVRSAIKDIRFLD